MVTPNKKAGAKPAFNADQKPQPCRFFHHHARAIGLDDNGRALRVDVGMGSDAIR